MTRSLRILSVLLLTAVAAGADDAPQAGAAKLIEQLDHDEYDKREAATRALILLGPDVAPQLKNAAESDSAEVSWRAMHALSEIAVADDSDGMNRAETALAELQKNKTLSIARQAEDLLTQLPVTRAERSIEMVRSLGGKVDESGTVLTLDGNWTGGENGMRYIKRIAGIRHIQIEPTFPVSKPAIEKFRATLSKEISVTQFGTAFLGVGSASNDSVAGMMVVTVRPDSPAAAGGIREGDVITKIDDKKIDNFNDLVSIIRSHDAGDEITIEFNRSDPETGVSKSQKAKVKLAARDGVVPGK